MRNRRLIMLGGFITVGAVLLAGIFFVPAAKAAWSTTREVSAQGWMGQDSPTVAVDRQGDRLLVWAACDGSQSGCYHQIQARTMPLGGSMGPIRTLSPAGAASAWPEVAADDTGDAAVVWEQDSRVVARRVSASGTVGTLRTLSPEVGANPNVAISPGGLAVVVWSDLRNGSWRTMAQFFNLDGTLGTLHDLGSGMADKVAVAMDRNGMAVVAWSQADGSVVARRLKPGYVSALTKFASPSATYGGYGMVRVAVDRDGDAVLTFRSGGGDRPRVWVRRWTRAGTVGSQRMFSSSTDSAGFHHAVESDLDGDTMLVWTRYNSSAGQTEVLGRRMTRTGTLGGTSVLGLGDRPDLALDDDGDGLVVWHAPGAPRTANEVHSRTISTAGSFGAAKKLSSDGRVARTDSSPTGRFAVIWQQRNYPYQIRAQFGP